MNLQSNSHPGVPGRPAPDDSEIDQIIAESETLTEALFHVADKYEAPVTNNEPRWKDGQYLRHVADFITDVKNQVTRFTPDPVPAGDTVAGPAVAALSGVASPADAPAVLATADEAVAKGARTVDLLAWESALWQLAAIERPRMWTYSGRDWRGWPQIGSDEYRRRTLVLGLPFVGAVVIALRRCRCADCAADIAALRDIVESEA